MVAGMSYVTEFLNIPLTGEMSGAYDFRYQLEQLAGKNNNF